MVSPWVVAFFFSDVQECQGADRNAHAGSDRDGAGDNAQGGS